MKLSNVLKVFGAAALVAGLTPYRVTRDEETGEKRVRALFWEASTAMNDEGEKDHSFKMGFFSPVERDDEEPHFFADELTVDYETAEPEAVAEEGEAAAEETVEETEEEKEAAAEGPEEAVEESEEEN